MVEPCFSFARIRSFLALAAGVLLTATSVAQTSAIRSRIVAQVDNSHLVKLQSGVSRLTAQSQDLGAVPDSTPAKDMVLVLARSADQEASLKQAIADLHNPNSPQFHKWLKPEDFGKRFGASDADLATITQWLQAQGFTVNKTSHSRTTITFSGTTGLVRQAFHTEIHTYSRNGTTFHANSTDPQIPAALSPVVSGFASLNDIQPHPLSHVLGQAKFNKDTHAVTPEWTQPADGGSYLVLAPGDFNVQYDVNPIYSAGYTGTGETIGIVSEAGVDLTVVANYRKLFGLPATLPTEIVDGTDGGSFYGSGLGDEADLDVEVSGSVAPNANIYLYASEGSNVTTGFIESAMRAVDDNIADVISVSYGVCEQQLGPTGDLLFEQLWAQAAAQGESVFVSSGDSGSAGCNNGAQTATDGLAVSGITSTPYNVSVGGTDFYYSDYNNTANLNAQIDTYWNTTQSTTPVVSLLKPIPEQPWNGAFGLNVGAGNLDNVTSSGSGGKSNCINGTADASAGEYLTCTGGYAKPSWQSAPGVPADGVRDVPDVSLFASNGYNFSFYPVCILNTDCVTNDPTTGAVEITGIGGTSASSPAMAGIMALIDQAQKGRQGNPNYVLYALANQVPSVFHDVAVGSNNVPCTQGTPNCSLDTNGDGFYTLQQYSAGAGYDLASGLGSVDANLLLTNWGKVSFVSTSTSLTLSQTTFKHGTPVTVSSYVGSSSGTPTGNVALVNNSTTTTQNSIGTMTLANGTSQASFSSLPAGTYQVTAQYGGDGKYAASTSDPVTVTVTSEGTTLALTGTYYGFDTVGNNLPTVTMTSPFAATYDGYYHFTVQAFGASSTATNPDGIPTGTITMLDNGAVVSSQSLGANGYIEFYTGSLAAGSHSLTFSYSGDASFNATTSSAFTVTVAKGSSQTYIDTIAQPTTAVVGVPYQIPVLVLNVGDGQLPVAGTVTVTMGTQSQTLTLTNQGDLLNLSTTGTAVATFTPTTAGSQTVTATYSGDSNMLPSSTSYSVNFITSGISASTTTLTLGATTISGEASLPVTVKVTSASGPIPTGTVWLEMDGIVAPTEYALDSTGTATITLAPTAIITTGNVQMIAVYNGDTKNAASESSPQTVAVNNGDFGMVATPAVVSMAAGTSGTTTISLSEPSTTFQGTAAMQCTTSSPNITCSLASSSVTLPSDGLSVVNDVLTINSVVTTANNTRSPMDLRPLGGVALAAMLLWLPLRKRRAVSGVFTVLLTVSLLVVSGCGGGAPVVTPANPTAQSGAYTATVTATVNGIKHAILVRVNVQ